jgi:hypothetical protein
VIHYSDICGCDGFLRHQLWEEENYDAVATAVENGQDIENFSLRGQCVLNQLESFHATKTLAPDLMHDFMEGKINFFTLSLIFIGTIQQTFLLYFMMLQLNRFRVLWYFFAVSNWIVGTFFLYLKLKCQKYYRCLTSGV